MNDEFFDEANSDELQCPVCNAIVEPGGLDWCPHYLATLCDGALIFEVDSMRPLQQTAESIRSHASELEADAPERLEAMQARMSHCELTQVAIGGEDPLQALLRIDDDVVALGPFETEGMLGDASHYYFSQVGQQRWIMLQKPRLEALDAALVRLMEQDD